MRRHVVAVAGTCAVALLLAGSSAVAQEAMQATEAMEVNIPFAFTVNNREMPAGHYEIGPAGDHLDRLIVVGDVNAHSGGENVAPVLERLADTGTPNPIIVFDNVGGTYSLSEAHYPGMDGFLVSIAGGKETHRVIRGTMKPQKKS